MTTLKREQSYTDIEIEELISWVKTLKVPGKAEMLRTLKNLKPYAKTNPLEDAHGSSLFAILDSIGYLDDSEELCLENA